LAKNTAFDEKHGFRDFRIHDFLLSLSITLILTFTVLTHPIGTLIIPAMGDFDTHVGFSS